MKEITLACEAFQKLLEEQLERIRNMNGEKTDFSTKKQVTIGVIDGDGIGPVITAQATRVLEKLLAEEIAAGSIVIKQIEGLTIENRMACGKAIPDDVLAEIKTCDVLLKGPTTTPMGGKMESANVAMRRELDLYANCRPVSIPEKNIDWMFFRENTEGEYVLGSRGVELPGMAVDFKVTTDLGTRRIARAALDYAKNNGKTHVAVVTKANIVKLVDGNFLKTAHALEKEYPGITVREELVDSMAAKITDQEFTKGMQVFLLPNLYGDIVTDVAAEYQGGLGTASSSNIGDQYALFEAIHGVGNFLVQHNRAQYADPCSLIRAMGEMISHIGYPEKKEQLVKALDICTRTERKVVITTDKDGATAEEFTDYLLDTLQREA